MISIIVAFEREATRQKICTLLERSGHPVRGSFRTGAETLRAVRKTGGIVICGYKLTDMTVDTLCNLLDGEALVMAIAPAGELQMSDAPDLIQVATPLSRSEFFEALTELLDRAERRRQPEMRRRTPADASLIEQAKALLMAREGLSESQAHAWIQKKSMQVRCKMTDTARRIINYYQND